MRFSVDFTNTGYIDDGILSIDTVENELGSPDGTQFSITAYDDEGNKLGVKKFDFEKLWNTSNGSITSSRKPIKSSLLYVIFKDGKQEQYEDSEDVRESLIDNPSVEHVETSSGEVLKKYGERIESSANRNTQSIRTFSGTMLKS